MKRILHVIATMPVGGAENVLLTTLRRLDPKQYQSVVCCIQDKGVLGAEVEKLGIQLIELHKLQKGGWDSSIIDDLVAVIQRENIDLVHGHLYHANLYARFAAKRAKVPSVITVHNTYAKRKWHRQLLNWYLARSSAKIIAVSDSIRDDVIQFDRVSPDKVVTILNGIDTERSQSSLSQAEARLRLQLPEHAKVTVTIGRLVEQKGHTILLQALQKLKQQGSSDVYAVLVGDGPWRQRLQDRAKALGLEKQIRFLGTRTDIGDILRAADLYIMPSLWEGLGLALLEGMAAGLPVLASRVGGMIEVLGEGQYGYLVPANDVAALAQQLSALLAPGKDLSQMASAAQKRVTDFSATRMVAAIEAVYTSVLRR